MSPHECRRLLITFTARAVRATMALAERPATAEAAGDVRASAHGAREAFRRLYLARGRTDVRIARQQTVDALESCVLTLQLLRLMDRLGASEDVLIHSGRELIAAVEQIDPAPGRTPAPPVDLDLAAPPARGVSAASRRDRPEVT